LRSVGVGATGRVSRYTWGAVTTDTGELCLGIPLDHFVVHRIDYDADTGSFHVDFDFGLAEETEAFPRRADFHAVVYYADPAWGFRSATEKYYRIYPQSFVRRSEREGLWMPFTSPSKVEGFEDFNFVFHEGSNQMGWDDAHDILSFPYVSPHWAMFWMPDVKDKPTPEFVRQRLKETIADTEARYHRMAMLVATSGIMNAEGGYHFRIGRAHWAPSDYGPVGWFANFPANSDPDLEQLGQGPTTGGNAWRAVKRVVESNEKKGVRVDGIYFDGVDERPPDNYNRAHWRFAEAPLTFGTDTKRPCMCGPFASYKFVKRVAEYLHPTGRLTMANGIPAQFPFAYHYLDVTGRELEPPIEHDPVSLDLLAMSRTFSHHKPCVYLYKPRLEERFDRDLSPYLIDYMNRCLLYAAEPSLFKIFSRTNDKFYYSFFERPDWYNRYRHIFIDYVPLVRELGLAGWEPVPYARAADGRVQVERFGVGEDLFLVAYNPNEVQTITTTLDVDLTALGWAAGVTPQVADLTGGARLPVRMREDALELDLVLPPRRSAVLAFRPSLAALSELDLAEAVRYSGIAQGRLRDRIEQRLPIDFEYDPDGDGHPAGWRHYMHPEGSAEYASDTEIVHSPPRSTRITLHGNARGTQSVTVPVRPGRTYRMSAWVRTDFPGGGNAHIYGQWLDDSGKSFKHTATSEPITVTSDWVQIVNEVTSPAEETAQFSFVLVATRRGEGDATVWFDDPRLVEVGENGAETVLLPLQRDAAPASADATATWLAKLRGELEQLAASAHSGASPEPLGRSALAQADTVAARAGELRDEAEAYQGVAAALDTCAMRLRRGARMMVGWGVTMTGRSQVAQGEAPEFTVTLHDAAVPVSDLRYEVTAPEGWGHEFTDEPPARLARGQTATVTLRLKGGGEGGTVELRVSGRVAGGHMMTISRHASFEVVPALQTRLVQQGQASEGGVQRLALVARNARARRPVTMMVRVEPPTDFTAEWLEKSLTIPASRSVTVPILLTASESVPAGWRDTRVTVTWDGGEAHYDEPFVYVPVAGNLLANPGFEDGDDQARGWGGYGEGGYSLDRQVKHSGAQAVRAVNEGARVKAGAVQRLTLNQKEPHPLVVRGWSLYQRPGGDDEELKTIGMTEHAGLGQNDRTIDYSVYVDLHFVGGGALYGQAATFDKSVSGWQFSEYIIHVPRPVADATVYLLFRNQEGTAWFDDITVAELGTNLAVLPGAEARTDSNFSGYSSAPLNDGSIRTEGLHWTDFAWASAEQPGGHWAEISLPEPREVRAVVIYWATDGGLQTSRSYRVQVEVGGEWRDVAAVTDQSPRAMSEHAFEPVTTARVRVLQPDGGGPAERRQIMWMREIEIY
ncbi:MAG: discoidin domain-containing protein, partial [Armatimonadetes bacterium]|nr:discoidin domain-containing protein [Armatimonadota bacterium]